MILMLVQARNVKKEARLCPRQLQAAHQFAFLPRYVKLCTPAHVQSITGIAQMILLRAPLKPRCPD